MADDPALDKLKKKINEAKKDIYPPVTNKQDSLTNKYFNIGVELVSGVVAGICVGFFIDWLFGSSPWGLISLFILGSAAGILNVYRTLTEHRDGKDA